MDIQKKSKVAQQESIRYFAAKKRRIGKTKRSELGNNKDKTMFVR
jgi:hypothetical protein